MAIENAPLSEGSELIKELELQLQGYAQHSS
jgi:hypothetical protein